MGFSAPKSLHVALTDESDGEGLGGLINETNEEWYVAKRPKATPKEIAFINSIGIERCRCCGRGFNPLTGTVFGSRKIPISQWVEFLVHLSQFLSTVVSSIDNHNASTTAIYWPRKAFASCERETLMTEPNEKAKWAKFFENHKVFLSGEVAASKAKFN